LPGESGWQRDDDNVYRMSVQVPLRLTHNQLAWALFMALGRRPLLDMSEEGDLVFAKGTTPRRDVRAYVLAWLGRNGTHALPQERCPMEEYRRAATIVYSAPALPADQPTT
jgi:hypothetical protein